MEAWKKAQIDFDNQKVIVQIDEWRQMEFKNQEEYNAYLKGNK